MDERGNTTKSTYTSQNKRSVLAYSLFAMMCIIGIGGVVFFYNFANNGPVAATKFTPFLSSPLVGGGQKCTIIPDAEDFTPCTSDWENIADSQVLRCPSGYGNIEVTKVKDGETGHKNYRDLALVRSFCQGTDSCRLTLGDLRAADDGMALPDQELIPDSEELEIDPEAIIEDVAGVDSNGEILLKAHGHHHHHHHHHAGKVKIAYECERLEESPFAELEALFEDLMGPEPATEETAFVHEATQEELILSKHHKHGCKNKLKNIAQDWDAGNACGTAGSEMTLSCDQSRSGARIYVLNVKAKLPKTPAVDPTTGADTGESGFVEDEPVDGSVVENEPFLSKHGHHGHKHGHGHKGSGKQLGHELTDVCAGLSECTTTLNVDLQASLAENPQIDDSTEMHVKYMCSYNHQEN